MKKNQLLLLADVDGLGRQGDVVTAKPGFVRNFLLPKKKAVIADKHTLLMREKLQKERAIKAAEDHKEAELYATKLAELVMKTEVKVDPEGKMYGSVAVVDILKLLRENGFTVEKRQIVLAHPLRSVGKHAISLKLEEGVVATFTLEIEPEGGKLPEAKEEPSQEAIEEEPNEGEELPEE
ncbi:MAG: 50S ribosomal protein L9 [Chlamydiae bacterium]|nr:50S ribosomal protein L9 [Chlamydiota bacterium]